MMQNALTSTGAYADWWSHLESMKHALTRVLDTSNINPLNELDRELLQRLVMLLKELPRLAEADEVETQDLLAQMNQAPLSFVADLRLEECLHESLAFKGWLSTRKLGFDKKLEKLLEASESFLSSASEKLFTNKAPRDEFQILSEVIDRMLARNQFLLHDRQYAHDTF
jgi:hypothetical protein